MSPLEQSSRTWGSRLIVLVPLLAFIGLAALFMLRLGSGDPSRIPSALIGQPAPNDPAAAAARAGTRRHGRCPASTVRLSPER